MGAIKAKINCWWIAAPIMPGMMGRFFACGPQFVPKSACFLGKTPNHLKTPVNTAKPAFVKRLFGKDLGKTQPP